MWIRNPSGPEQEDQQLSRGRGLCSEAPVCPPVTDGYKDLTPGFSCHSASLSGTEPEASRSSHTCFTLFLSPFTPLSPFSLHLSFFRPVVLRLVLSRSVFAVTQLLLHLYEVVSPLNDPCSRPPFSDCSWQSEAPRALFTPGCFVLKLD